ncbi:hypothetical protein BDN72DRAFT_946360, partial [Pluteus cervinus]
MTKASTRKPRYINTPTSTPTPSQLAPQPSSSQAPPFESIDEEDEFEELPAADLHVVLYAHICIYSLTAFPSRSPEDYPIWKGRMLGRHRFGFRNYFTILEEGVAWYTKGRLSGQAPSTTVLAYQELIQFAPLLPRCIEAATRKGGLVLIATQVTTHTQDFHTYIHVLPQLQLDFGRSSARNADVHALKKEMSAWAIFDPPFMPRPRHLLGFNHQTTGRCLCPPHLNWDDESIQAALRDGKMRILPEDLPRFLWGAYELGWDSFMRGPVVLCAVRHIYIAPTAAHSRPEDSGKAPRGTGTKKGNAAIHDIRNVTIHTLAYAATI